MAKEYIERGELIQWLTKATGFKSNCEDCTGIGCLDCIVDEAIKNAPAADVVEVVYGEWIYDANGTPRCSECGEETEPHAVSEFCPNCGSDMRGDNDE